MLGHPGRLSHAFFAIGITDKEAKQARAGLVAGAVLCPARRRYPVARHAGPAGQVLAAADQGQSFEPTGADVPDWLHYLVNDALFGTCSETREDATSANRPAWNVRLLMRLLAVEGLPEAPALELVFERRHVAHYMMERCLQRLLVPNVIDNVMQEQPAECARWRRGCRPRASVCWPNASAARRNWHKPLTMCWCGSRSTPARPAHAGRAVCQRDCGRTAAGIARPGWSTASSMTHAGGRAAGPHAIQGPPRAAGAGPGK